MSASSHASSEQAEVELAVTGMHCASCVALIEETLSARSGVESVSVDLEAARAAVKFDPATIAVGEICSVLAGLGYAAGPATGSAPAPA